jgi:eukaryotic-like serine/threonine-protein kinase
MNGRIIGHYRVLETIGSGAMGEVFRARDERLARDVAVKVIRQTSSNNPDHLRRFETEARSAAALNHPNIVAVYDVGVDDGSPYIVCELLEGETLRERLGKGALPIRAAIDYALQITQGLIAAHDRRITHRDLKPENLFITNDGRVKILDFGVAKLQSALDDPSRPARDLTTITKSGVIIGTVAYMSPEQLRGKPVDSRSDIFSMGAILYEMVAGTRPFRGETEVDTITAVLREDPPEIDLEQAGIPIPFRQIIRHCLEKEAEKRFQSTRDLAFALETLSQTSGARVRLRRPSLAVKIVPWAVAGFFLIASLFLLEKASRQNPPFPRYNRVTFEQGTIYSARFGPEFHSILYGAAWNGRPLQLFSTVGDSLFGQPLNLKDANLLAVSKTGELAVVLGGAHTAHLVIENGMLARTPLAGGSPREILENVRWADWDSKGELAVVHHADGRDRIEYPIGHVIYQSDGWISHIRFSPNDDWIAFINHPALWDDRGLVMAVNLGGNVKTLSGHWDSADGLAWSSNGKEIWFTAAENGYTRALHAVDSKGQIRTVFKIPAGLTLQDIAPDGRVLVSLDAERLSLATSARDGKAVDISWHDWDDAKDISQDGQSVLFEDASEAASQNYSVAIRKLDGTPPTKLGEGSAGGLSPDGKWAIGIIVGKPGRITLYPIGSGQPRDIPVKGLEQIDNGISHFLADGKRITINGIAPGHAVRCYLLDLDSGQTMPATPEGITGGLVSPNGRFIIANNGTEAAVYEIATGASHPLPGIGSRFVPLRWSEDESVIYGYAPSQSPIKLYKLNLVTGEKSVIQELRPESLNGVVSIAPIVVNRDGSRFAYSYYQVSSVLYVLSGLR